MLRRAAGVFSFTNQGGGGLDMMKNDFVFIHSSLHKLGERLACKRVHPSFCFLPVHERVSINSNAIR